MCGKGGNVQDQGVRRHNYCGCNYATQRTVWSEFGPIIQIHG